MAKLTRKQAGALRDALRNAERARAYIMAPTTAVAVRTQHATTTLHYVRPSDGAALYEVNREYGSDLTGLSNAIAPLEKFLEIHCPA